MNTRTGLINLLLFGLLGYVLNSAGITDYEFWSITSLVVLIILNILLSDL